MKYRIISGLIFFVVILLSSCQSDPHGGWETTPGEIDMTVAVNLPGRYPSSTRALSSDEENEVNTIEVLVFDEDQGYLYTAYGSDIKTDPGNRSLKTFKVTLRKGKFDLIILANSRTELVSGISPGTKRDEVAQTLVSAMSQIWNTNSGSASYRHIPMWGEMARVTVDENTTFNNKIKLVRALAKTDVVLMGQAAQDFKLTSVRVYNYMPEGQIIPSSTNWKENSQTENIEITAPSIPSLTDVVKGPLVLADGAITDGKECVNEIYMFEAPSGSRNGFLTNTCLVIGGIWEGVTHYYRVDFARDNNGLQEYLDILRNYRYRFVISEITGPGFPDPDEAFNSLPFNIVSQVQDWNEGGVSNIAFDGQNIIGISKDEFNFSRDQRTETERDNVVEIYTDWSTTEAGAKSGWYVEKIVDAVNQSQDVSWVSLTPDEGDAESKVQATLLLSENNTGNSRSAIVWIAAGRLRIAITVNQSTTYRLDLRIIDPLTGNDIDMLEFTSLAGTQPAMKPFAVKWVPTERDVTIHNVSMSRIEFDPGSGIPAAGTIPGGVTGTEVYLVQPAALTTDVFEDRVAKLDFTITDGENYQTATIFLTQSAFGIESMPEKAYLLDGKTSSFRVKSNYEWTAEIVQNENNVISQLLTVSGGSEQIVEETISFRKSDQPAPLSKAMIRIKSRSGNYPDHDIPLTFVYGEVVNESNSYILTTGDQYGVLIPVLRANKTALGNQIGNGEAVDSELVWTDNQLGEHEDSNISLYHHFGDGPDSYLFVLPGKSEGNGVVAIKCNGKIVWSWHLWVCHSGNKPKVQNGYMDRNLGAFATAWNGYPDKNTSIGDPVTGLYYQWGRKDPFPNTVKVVYGTPITGGTLYVDNSYENSLRNPIEFYPGLSKHNYNTAGELWGNGTGKSINDPCPEGYRVANASHLTSTLSYWATSSSLGLTRNNYGGFYPAAGSRDVSTVNIGKDVSIWIADKYPAYSNQGGGRRDFLVYQGGNFSNVGTTTHAWRWAQDTYFAENAIPVRCVADS